MNERERDTELSPELQRAVGELPRSIEPPADLWPGIRDRIRQGKREGGRGLRWWIPLALAAALVLAVGLRVTRHGNASWGLERTAGAPRVDGTPMGISGTLRVGGWVETDDSSQAVIAVGTIGHVDVRPGSRVGLVRARDTDRRLTLAYGAIHAKVDAPPRIFFVETPAGTAIDLGCEYTLETDRAGRGLIHVTGGYVEFAAHGTRSIVPLGAFAMTRPGQAPGIPYLEDAPAALREALDEPLVPLTADERRAWLARLGGVSLVSDGFIPFRDNIEHAQKHGVSFIAQPGGSTRDDIVIRAANEYGMTMVFSGVRLFHH